MSKLELATDIPTENEIRNAIADYLTYQGWLVIRINSGAAQVTENGKRRWLWFVKWSVLGQGTQTAGISDLLCIKPDYPPMVVETKRPGNTPTEAQERFIAEWVKRGGMAVIATTIDDVQAIINNSMTKGNPQ